MLDLQYLEPTTLGEAVSLLARYGDEAKAIAGGQTLIPMLRQRLLSPSYLVSLSAIPELRRIEKDGQGNLLIGACASHRAVEVSPQVREGWPILAETVAKVAAPQIRNLGTLGGDLCHSEYGADPPATLLALEAQARIVGPTGERWLPLEEFFVDLYQTALGPAELLTQLKLPPLPSKSKMIYIKYALRAMDPAIVGVAVVMEVEDGRCRKARIGLNGAAPVPLRARQAEAALQGRRLDQATLEEAARAAQAEAAPFTNAYASAEYRRRMVGVFVKRALRLAQGESWP
jgi:carbon-monoxide dehydrogenase medium subunit